MSLLSMNVPKILLNLNHVTILGKIDSFFGRHFCTLKSLESPIELKFGMMVYFGLLLLLSNYEINFRIIRW